MGDADAELVVDGDSDIFPGVQSVAFRKSAEAGDAGIAVPWFEPKRSQMVDAIGHAKPETRGMSPMLPDRMATREPVSRV